VLGRIRTRDPLLRRSFPAAGQAPTFLIRVGLLVVWLELNVSGFRPVLARSWHGWPSRSDPSLVSYRHVVVYRRSPGIWLSMSLAQSAGVLCRCGQAWWSVPGGGSVAYVRRRTGRDKDPRRTDRWMHKFLVIQGRTPLIRQPLVQARTLIVGSGAHESHARQVTDYVPETSEGIVGRDVSCCR
jgi:hypothetical protein